MQSYPSGKIQEVNAGFKVTLLKGAVVKTFASDEQAVEFTTKVMKEYAKENKIPAAVSFARSNGIKTYMIFNEKNKPFEISEFRYIQTHSAFFAKSKLRSIIDVHNVSFKGIARVTASGTPMTATISWIRILTSIILFMALGGTLLYYFNNPTQKMINNGATSSIVVDLLGALLGCGWFGISLSIYKKIYYHFMIGARKDRDIDIIHEIQQKNWGRFRRLTRITDGTSVLLLPIEIGLIVAIAVLLKDTPYFQDFTQYWQSYFFVVWGIVMAAYLVTLLVFAIRAWLIVRKFEKALVNTYVPAQFQKYYKLFLRNKENANQTFPFAEGHRMLKDVPQEITREMIVYKQPAGAEATKHRRKWKKAYDAAVKNYKSMHGEIK